MISIVVLSFIAAQTGIAIYVSNTLPLKSNFDRLLNIFLVILFFHLGTKLFFLAVLKDSFLYNNNATGFGLSYGPMLYLLTKISMSKPITRKAMVYHLLPFFAFTLLYIFNCVGHLTRLWTEAVPDNYTVAYQWVVTLSLLVYPVLSLGLLKKNNKLPHIVKVENLKLLNTIAYIITTGVIAGLCYAIVQYGATGRHDSDPRLVAYMFIASLSFLILRYKLRAGAALVQVHPVLTANIPLTVDMTTKEEDLHQEKKYKKSAIDTKMMDSYETVLKKFMEKSRIHLQPEVSLEDLSDGSGIPKHHLTQLLNERFEKKFYSFINEYRIEEAIKKLKSPGDDHLSMLSLAYDCGFNSKSSFNNYFKKMTGHTPSTFRKEHLLAASEK